MLSAGNMSESYFFSCIAGLVRDMVGQQLELVEIEIKFPRTKTNTQQRTKQSNTHTQTRHQATDLPGKFAH